MFRTIDLDNNNMIETSPDARLFKKLPCERIDNFIEFEFPVQLLCVSRWWFFRIVLKTMDERHTMVNSRAFYYGRRALVVVVVAVESGCGRSCLVDDLFTP